MDNKPNSEFLRYAVSGVDAEYEAEVKQAEQRRNEKVANLHKWWLGLGGSEEDLAAPLSKEVAAPHKAEPLSKEVANFSELEESVDRKPQRSRAGNNGSGGRAISQDVIHRFVQEVMDDVSIDIVTQTEIKDNLLREYPDAKLPSVRSAISNELSALVDQGYLELIERGRASKPSKYRKIKKTTEVSLLQS